VPLIRRRDLAEQGRGISPGLAICRWLTTISRVRARWIAGAVAAVAAIAVVVAPPVALAHGGGQAFIHVPVDPIVPGETFPLVGADLGENAAVAVGLLIAGEVVSLGTLAAGPDGHFEATLVLPASVEAGYVQLVAQSTDGSFASTWVRVGTASAPDRPLSGTVLDLVDPSLLLAGAAILVITVFLLARERLPRAGQTRS
jgi:hypothetical protein